MVAQMQDKKETQAGNIEHDKECREFKKKIDALRLQVQELEKLGDNDNAKLLKDQLPGLEKQYAETCG